MNISNNTPAGEFSWHFRSLMERDRKIQMIGSKPETNGIHRSGTPEQSFEGSDAIEAYELAKTWNTEGYDISFRCQNPKNIASCGWLGILVHVDKATIDATTALDRLTEINNAEFMGKANILDCGDEYWILVRLRNHPIKNASDAIQQIKSTRNFCVELGNKWDLSSGVDVPFCLDALDFFPIAAMPAAGMVDHRANPPYLINWYCYLQEDSPPGIVEKVNAARDHMKMLIRIFREIPESDNRKSSCIDFREGFTIETLNTMIAKNPFLKKLMTSNHSISQRCDIIETNLDLISFLREHLIASPVVIEHAILERIRHWPITFTARRLASNQIARGIVASDRYSELYYKLRVGEEPELRTRMKIDNGHLSVPLSCEVFKLEQAVKQCEAMYGSQIHIAHPGWFLIRNDGSPRKMIHARDRSFHYKIYVPFVCEFWVAADRVARGKGALLVPYQIADVFSNALSQRGELDNKTIVYFWRHGNQFAVLDAPAIWADDAIITVNDLVDWACKNSPNLYRIWKLHRLDRERRK
jgi:hypothetical protein